VRQRAIQFFEGLASGNYLMFSHGGLMVSLAWYLGMKTCPTNCSVLALSLDE